MVMTTPNVCGTMSPPPKNITVLVADDSALIRNSTAHIVRKLGYNPIMAADGNACIELLNTHQIDLLLLDTVVSGKK